MMQAIGVQQDPSMVSSSLDSDGSYDGGKEKKISKAYWTKEQDTYLRSVVRTYGTRQWDIVADNVNDKFKSALKTAKQCRQRWQKHVDPTLAKQQWSEQEEVELLLAHQKYKNSWSDIAIALKNRDNNSIKNRFYTIFRKVRNKAKKSDYTYTSKHELLQMLYVVSVMESYLLLMASPEESKEKQGKDFACKLVEHVNSTTLLAYKQRLCELTSSEGTMEQLFAKLSKSKEEEKLEAPAAITMPEEQTRIVVVPIKETVPVPSGKVESMDCVWPNDPHKQNTPYVATNDPFDNANLQMKDCSSFDPMIISPLGTAICPKFSPCILSAGPAAAAAAAFQAPCFQRPADDNGGFSEFTESAEDKEPQTGYYDPRMYAGNSGMKMLYDNPKFNS